MPSNELLLYRSDVLIAHLRKNCTIKINRCCNRLADQFQYIMILETLPRNFEPLRLKVIYLTVSILLTK